MSGFEVYEKPCDECLISASAIVGGKRRREIIATCTAKDTHFICHKSKDVACRGFFDAFPGVGNLRRIAERLGCVDVIQRGGKR